MTSGIDRSVGRDTCKKLISLGFARSNHVRLYGQELQLISDPFPQDDGGFAIEVLAKTEKVTRTMKLPLPVLHVASKGQFKRSA